MTKTNHYVNCVSISNNILTLNFASDENEEIIEVNLSMEETDKLLCSIFNLDEPLDENLEDEEATKNITPEVTSIRQTDEDIKEQMLFSELLEDEEANANIKDLPHWIVEA